MQLILHERGRGESHHLARDLQTTLVATNREKHCNTSFETFGMDLYQSVCRSCDDFEKSENKLPIFFFKGLAVII